MLKFERILPCFVSNLVKKLIFCKNIQIFYYWAPSLFRCDSLVGGCQCQSMTLRFCCWNRTDSWWILAFSPLEESLNRLPTKLKVKKIIMFLTILLILLIVHGSFLNKIITLFLSILKFPIQLLTQDGKWSFWLDLLYILKFLTNFVEIGDFHPTYLTLKKSPFVVFCFSSFIKNLRGLFFAF